MARATDPPVGQRIREQRNKRGISLRGLARDVGVSASLISQIETGKCQPSVSTLYAITMALGVSIEDVFEPASTPPAGLLTAPDSAPGARSPASTGSSNAPLSAEAALAVLTAARGSNPVARADEREVLRLDSGVTWERLGHVPGFQVDFLLVTYAPGGSSSSSGRSCGTRVRSTDI